MRHRWIFAIRLCGVVLMLGGCRTGFETIETGDIIVVNDGGSRRDVDGAPAPDASGNEGQPPRMLLNEVDLGRVVGANALYLFNEGAGNYIYDHSQVGEFLDLSILDPAIEPEFVWRPGALDLSTALDLIIRSDEMPSKLVDPCVANQAFTVEAWVHPATEQDGPARIVTVSAGSEVRNFTLGQGGQSGDRTSYSARIRTRRTDPNGTPDIITNADTAIRELRHVVLRGAVVGEDLGYELFVDGADAGSGLREGGLDPWSATPNRLALANEHDADRRWRGTFHLVAIYCRALDNTEVTQNFNAGADPELNL